MWKITRSRPVDDPLSLDDRLTRLESQFKQIRVENEELADKVFRWMKRSRAREKVDEPAAVAGSPAVDPLSAAILARRRRGVPTGNGE